MKTNQHHEDECGPAVSRRTILKIAAGAPLVLTFGLLASPLARFLKPTMEPGGFFQEADFPTTLSNPEFKMADFPTDWICYPFQIDLNYVVFNPQQKEIRRIPGFVVRVAPDQIVAFSRICTVQGCILNYAKYYCCGCAEGLSGKCSCPRKVNNPVLVCPCDLSVFDLAQGGSVVSGPAARPPRQFQVLREGDVISIGNLESGSIAVIQV